MHWARTLLVVVVSSVAAARAQDQDSGGPLLPEQAAYDVAHYDLALTVDPAERSIEGTLTVTARVLADLPVLVLDLDRRLTVRAASAGETECAFEHRDGRVRVTLPQPAAKGDEIEVAIAYGGVPRRAPRAPWDGGFTWAETPDGSPWIATTCQTDGADLWWPCKDHPSDEPDSFDLHITVPAPLVCASNGRLVRVEKKGRTRTYHWHVSTPINNYCVALNIAPYVTLSRKYRSVAGDRFDVTLWVLPQSAEKARPFVDEFIGHLRWFEQNFGPYPFRADKYGVAETPHLGMEHQTIIAYGNRWRRQRAWDYDWLHHHELSHEWWGNLVTARDWKDMWIHEGIGTYCQWLYIEDRHGEKAYLTYARQQRRGIANRQPVAPRETTSSKRIYGGDIYNKGAAVLHTLRWLIGREELLRVLRRMAYPDPELEKVTDGSQCRLVDTEELVALAEKITGRELSWFFDVYLHQPKLPVLDHEIDGGVLSLRWEVPEDLPFPMPVEVVVEGVAHRVDIVDGAAKLTVGDAEWAIDPDGWILRGR